VSNRSSSVRRLRAGYGLDVRVRLQQHAADDERAALERVERAERASLRYSVKIVEQARLAAAVGGGDGQLAHAGLDDARNGRIPRSWMLCLLLSPLGLDFIRATKFLRQR